MNMCFLYALFYDIKCGVLECYINHPCLKAFIFYGDYNLQTMQRNNRHQESKDQITQTFSREENFKLIILLLLMKQLTKKP